MRLDDELRFFAQYLAPLIEPFKQTSLQIFRLKRTDGGHGMVPAAIEFDDEFNRGKFGGFNVAEASADGGGVIREIPDRAGKGAAEHEKYQNDHDHIDHGCHIRTHMSRGMHADFRAF